MTGLFWLSCDQFDCIKPYFPCSHGTPRAGDLRLLAGLTSSLRMGCASAMRQRNTARSILARALGGNGSPRPARSVAKQLTQSRGEIPRATQFPAIDLIGCSVRRGVIIGAWQASYTKSG
jgi:hypothetical protein